MNVGHIQVFKTYADWARACNAQVSKEASELRKFIRRPALFDFYTKGRKEIDSVLKSYEEKGFWGDTQWYKPVRKLSK